MKLQEAAREYVLARYGPEPYKVQVELSFPDSMPDFETLGAKGQIVIELGPLAYVPYSVYLFLEVVSNFKHGAFHRMAGHVTQALVRSTKSISGLAFQGNFLLIYLCNFHVLSHLPLIYICKLHWNLKNIPQIFRT